MYVINSEYIYHEGRQNSYHANKGNILSNEQLFLAILLMSSTMVLLFMTSRVPDSLIDGYSVGMLRRLQTAVPQVAPTAIVPQEAPSPSSAATTALVTAKYAAGQLEGAESYRGYKEISGNHFPQLIAAATSHKRGRKMNDLTKDPETNSLQTLLNTWTDGSYSPVHKHFEYAETFVALSGALAFFTFTANGTATCHILHDGHSGGTARAIVIEKNEWHAMTAAPKALGYVGFAVVFETSGHYYNKTAATKVLAPFAPHDEEGVDGDKVYFQDIIATCPKASVSSS